MDRMKTLGILSVLLIAGAGVASAFPWGGQGLGEGCADRPAPEEMQAVREAIASGDWETYTSLRDEYGLDSGIHALLTEKSFLKLSEIQQKREELKLLKKELAEELGLEDSKWFAGKGMRFGMRGMRFGGSGRGVGMVGGAGEGG